MNWTTLNDSQKKQLLIEERAKFDAYKAKNLSLDMSRGKPCKEQLDLAMGLLDTITSSTDFKRAQDYRNYGILDGITEIKDIFCDLLNINRNEIIVAGNASLILMYDTIQRAMQFGVMGNEPWNKQGKIKWLCPVPGYDRHFAITELFGIEMINIPMDDNGPDMALIEEYVKDPQVKGIWCVPKYSNPMGIIYSDEVVERFASLKPAAKDFRIFWDNAYMIHGLYGYEEMKDIFATAKKYDNEDIVYVFGSTSKVSFAGAGVAFISASEKNIASLKKLMTIQQIGPDKVMQYAHALYFKDKSGLLAQMDKHAEILRPKFEKVLEILDRELAPTGIAKWNNPRGGYFVSCFLPEGTAKRTVALAKEAGVVFTGAGATYPYKLDPADSNLRIAPSLPPLEELEVAMEIFCCAAKIAYLEK